MSERQWNYRNPQVRFWYTGAAKGQPRLQATIIISRAVKLLGNEPTYEQVLESIENDQNALQFFAGLYKRKPVKSQWQIIHDWCREFDYCIKNHDHIRTNEEHEFRASVTLPMK